jgi:hypothetical protein
MENKNAKVYVASVVNISKRLRYYGDANIDKISLLKLIYKYACYSTTYSTLQRLDKMVAELQRTSPYICSEKQAEKGVDYTNIVSVVEIGVDSNTAPTITDSAISVDDDVYTYTFSYADLFSGYADTNGDALGNFVIKSLPSAGTLQYDGSDAVVETLYSDVTLLTYVRNGTGAYGEDFTYSAYDNDSQLPLESNTATCTATVVSITITNSDPYVGDRTMYAENEGTTVFSSSDFTTDTIDPYSDAEGDQLAAIKILEISEANTGTYYFFGTELAVGQEITKVELDSGALYHVGPDVGSVSTDSFRCAAKADNANADWVE